MRIPLRLTTFFFSLLVFPCWPGVLQAQDSTRKDFRKWAVAGIHAGGWTGTFIALNKAWYEGYEKTGMHSFNDGGEWNQMDKLGHVWTAYQLGRASGELWKWSGLPNRSAILLGGASAVAFQSIIEIQDGFSAKWGFSWWDMAANVAGAGVYVAQELGWKEQRIQVKMGYWPYMYPAGLQGRRNELFGSGVAERVLKDYNGQTYWLSANLHSFFPESRLPVWLNVAMGYSSDLMLGGTENRWAETGGQIIDRTDIRRTRRFYLSADIDLTRIPTRSRWLRTLFFAMNCIKIPAPALELNSDGRLRLHALQH